jgi:putative transposase
MDDHHLLAAVRYIELNPVRARICDRPEDWPRSSARAHLAGPDDDLVVVSPMQSIVHDWSAYLSQGGGDDEFDAIRLHDRTGRPPGSGGFIASLEQSTGRQLRKRKAGRPSKTSKAVNADKNR